MDLASFNAQLIDFLDTSPTAYHAVAQMSERLRAAGFQALDETRTWVLEANRRYFVVRGGALIAFTYPADTAGGYLMLGAHTDSPHLKIKPNPTVHKEGITQLSVEPYGGLLINPWFDRDLSIAGNVQFLDEALRLQECLIDLKEPVATIASLAIHLDPNANKERSVNLQKEILPLLTCNPKFDLYDTLLAHIDPALHPKKILSHDLSLYDTQKARIIGFEREFIASSRLDNLLSCFVNLQSLLHVRPDQAVMMAALDHEEVGSASTSGAAGAFMEQVIMRIYPHSEERIRAMRRSLLLSCDNAHAVHPNFADKHESEHKPRIGGGVVIKHNANQRYATGTLGASLFKLALERADEPYQLYTNRSDMGCGSTIGPICATRLGVETLDVGLPTLGMHSIRELAGVRDAFGLWRTVLALADGRNA
ncbi:MAG: M18 family aminopeptidase [Campylobacterales bacterium]|nr:M18 family aminopeptidase [Campylobacterales bacterium]